MTYKDAIQISMEKLAKDPKVIFLGYNVKYGSKANGTLINIPDSQLIETPVAENLIVSTAIGLSLEGFKPVAYIERFDFMLNAIDAIVNHLDKIKELSNNEFNPEVMIRTVIGNKQKPLFTGKTHTQDFTNAFKSLVKTPIFELPQNSQNIIDICSIHKSCIIVERKDLYGNDC